MALVGARWRLLALVAVASKVTAFVAANVTLSSAAAEPAVAVGMLQFRSDVGVDGLAPASSVGAGETQVFLRPRRFARISQTRSCILRSTSCSPSRSSLQLKCLVSC